MNQFDIAVFWWLSSWAGVGWDGAIIFRAVYLWYLVMAVVAFLVVVTFFPKFREYRRRHLELFLFVFFSAFTARFIFTELIRFFYHRPRPFEMLEGVRVLQHQLIGNSLGVGAFPSGHAALAFAVATTVSFYYPKTSILFFLAAVSIGLGRVTAGVHWPSDIVGGAIVGIGTALFIRFLWRKAFEKKAAF